MHLHLETQHVVFLQRVQSDLRMEQRGGGRWKFDCHITGGRITGYMVILHILRTTIFKSCSLNQITFEEGWCRSKFKVSALDRVFGLVLHCSTI